MEKEIICTICPIGCNIIIKSKDNKVVSIEGNQCKRGLPFAEAEFSNPVRILTSIIKTDNHNNPLVPVRSSKPIPKHIIFDCMAKIRAKEVKTPIKRYDILIENICNTGVDIISTANIK